MQSPATTVNKLKTSTLTGSLERWIRTLVHVLIALPASIAIIANVPFLQSSQYHSTLVIAIKYSTVMAATLLSVTAAWNALEAKGIIPAMLRYVPAADVPAEITGFVTTLADTAAAAATAAVAATPLPVPSTPADLSTSVAPMVSSIAPSAASASGGSLGLDSLGVSPTSSTVAD